MSSADPWIILPDMSGHGEPPSTVKQEQPIVLPTKPLTKKRKQNFKMATYDEPLQPPPEKRLLVLPPSPAESAASKLNVYCLTPLI